MRRAALGWKTHSGWAALVVVTVQGEEIEVVDRRRVDFVGPDDPPSVKAPFHAAEALGEAAAREMRAALERASLRSFP